MRVIKKINNNVAICLDGNGKELVAFGKGIGFPQVPYEITDLGKVDRTFYNISRNYLALVSEIPEDIIVFTARLLDVVRNELPYELNPNLVLTLSDHIAFCIERTRKSIYIHMPLVYEMSQTYSTEVRLGKFILGEIEKKFKLRLNPREATGIAMSFVNARMDAKSGRTEEVNQKLYDEILEGAAIIIEREFDFQINRNSFNYARFATHLQYLFERLRNHKMIDSKNSSMYQSIRMEYPEIDACIEKIDVYFKQKLNSTLSEEEKLYLILHVNRVCAKEGL